MRSLYYSCFLFVSALTASLPRRSNDTTIVIEAPLTAPASRQVVDSVFQSYSIEFNYMLDYAGNNSSVLLATSTIAPLTHRLGIRMSFLTR